MNKYKVKVYKTIVQEFYVDIYADSEEDIKKVVNGFIDSDTIDFFYDDKHFENSVYCNTDIDEWDWSLDPYNEDIIEETYELDEIELKI